MTSIYNSNLPVAQDWVERIEDDFGFERSNHGSILVMESNPPIEDWSYGATVGKFIEEVQSFANRGYSEGQRAAFEYLIANGRTVQCPICEKGISRRTKRRLHEDVLMCEECFYK